MKADQPLQSHNQQRRRRKVDDMQEGPPEDHQTSTIPQLELGIPIVGNKGKAQDQNRCRGLHDDIEIPTV